MKRIFALSILFILCHFSLAQNDFTREFKTKPGMKLGIDLTTGGSIEIEGWDKNIVSVRAIVDDNDIEDYDIDIEERSSGIEINVSYGGYGRGRGGVDLEIFVPKKYDLEIETMGGEITIQNLEGEIEGETMGGEVELSGLKGKVELTTMGGDITVEDSDLDGEVKTMGGEVLFEDVVGDLKGSTMGGDVIYRNVKRRGKLDEGKGKEIRISTMGGEINVDFAPGGANVSTMGGDIQIRSAAIYVKAKTMGGDIDIDEIDGGAEASTMGGDVTVKMIGDPDKGDRDIDLSSMGGDIKLTLPAGLSIDFDITLTYTKRSRKDYKIISDFSIELEESEDWDYSEGSARKYIYGTGKISGGKNKIRIDTINGNIVIEKGSR
jgi:DUF4097 and DUF4098 domain-containing protein YvlB